MKKQKLKVALLIIFFLFVGSTYFTSQLLHQGNHTIAQNGEWSSLKLLDRLILMGGQEFFEQRQALAFNRLNLGEWHGHNEVTWSKAVGPWDQLNFKMKLKPNAFLWFFVSGMNNNRHGLRLSQNADFPSGFFTLDESDKIVEKEFLNLKPQNSFSEVTIKIRGERVSFFLDNQLIIEKTLKLPIDRTFSFRSGARGVAIDEIEVKTGSSNLHESFSPKFELNYLYLSTAVVLILSLVIWLFSLVVIQKVKRIFFLITYKLLLVIFLITASLIDRFILAPSYLYKSLIPYGQVAASEAVSKVEIMRRDLFFKLAEFCGAKKPVSLPPMINYLDIYQLFDSAGKISKLKNFEELKDYSQHNYKIAYLGTSQTWGAGAPGPENSFPHIAVTELRKKINRTIGSFNISVSGSWIEPLMKDYQKLLKVWKPDLLVVNLSSNDRRHRNSFDANLRKLAELNRTHKIKTIFILEAINKEASSTSIRILHQKMTQIGKAYQIPVFDLMGFVNSPEIYDSGLIWFDEFHMDRYGHQLTGKWLAEKLAPVIMGLKEKGE